MVEYGILMESELPSLLELYRQLNPADDAVSERVAKAIWSDIAGQNINYFVAKESGKIIASCYLCVIPNLTRGGKSIGLIENVITDAAHRRMGIGKTVVKNAVEYAKKQGCYKVILHSRNERTAAHRFYEAVGFNSTSKKAFEVRL